MDLKKARNLHLIYMLSFVLLNILNTYFVTTRLLNRYISPVSRTFLGEINAIVGNFSILFIILVITYVVVRKDLNRIRVLLYVTLFLNVFIYLINIYNMFYSSTFTVYSLDIFKNPSEGISKGLVDEALLQLIVYYRILIFVPFITLLVLLLKYKKVCNGHSLSTSVPFRRVIISGLYGVSLVLISSTSYLIQINNNDFNINSISSTQGIQNYGVYPYYLTELFGIKLNHTSKKSLGIRTLTELEEEYDFYNKNKDKYINFIDRKEYSNNLLAKDSIVTDLSLLGINEDESLNGIFKDKNLVLVHLESLNYFLFEIPEIRERFTFLNKLFEESIVFENYYTSVGMGVSSDAELSVLTGLYPNGYSTFYRDYEKGNYEIDSLPKLFSEYGYISKAFHGDSPIFYNRDRAYQTLIGFTEDYYTINDFAIRDGYDSVKKYLRDRARNGIEYNGLKIFSTWPSEFELHDVMYEYIDSINQKHMVFPMYLTMHTPYLFNPYTDQSYEFEFDYRLKPITNRYIEYVKYIDELIESTFFNPITKESRIDSNSVYVFYSDHGSGIKNGDLEYLYGRELSAIEERTMLQKTIAFIYAPSDTIDPVTNLNKGLIKGNQKLVRSHIDLYRTIGDLFGLFDETNFYFGVNGLSLEPTFVIDNRIQDLVIDNINDINQPFIVSLRNLKQKYPDIYLNNQVYVINKIKRFKQLSDLILIDDSVYKDYKSTLS